MDRNCLSCKRSGAQAWNVCGYIPTSERRKKLIDFPALRNPDLTVNACPVYFYNKGRYLYDWFNTVKDSTLDLRTLSLGERVVYKEFKNYINLRTEYILKKEREKNGN